jgi:pimeloyl-ACP methyl ester carboxylesterase
LRALRYVLLVEVVLLVALAIVGTIYQAHSNSRDASLHPAPGKLIDIGGYRLHLYCTGSGDGPTVVLDYGLGGSYLDWYFVQTKVAQFARVCSWDRSGYGWSERSPSKQVPSVIAGELHAVLERAGEKSPFILVGHSLGAFDVRMYAHRYPDQVAGVVLVDGAHPDEVLAFHWRDRLMIRFLQFTAPFGLPRWRGWCTAGPQEIRPLKAAFNCHSRVFRAHYEQWSVFPESAEEVRKLGSLGNLPLRVISRDPNRKKKHPNSAVLLAQEQQWTQYQQDLVKLSSDSTQVIAESSGHSVPTDRPDVVAEAIRKIIEQLQRTKAYPQRAQR